jgi:hypothetical protein
MSVTFLSVERGIGEVRVLVECEGTVMVDVEVAGLLYSG